MRTLLIAANGSDALEVHYREKLREMNRSICSDKRNSIIMLVREIEAAISSNESAAVYSIRKELADDLNPFGGPVRA